MNLNLLRNKRVEILKFKDSLGQIAFKELTTNTTVFTDCVKNMHIMSYGSQKWISTVKPYCNKSFKKIQIWKRNIRPSATDNMITQRNRLVRQDRFYRSRLVDVKIAKMISEEGRNKAFMFKTTQITVHCNIWQKCGNWKKRCFLKSHIQFHQQS